MSVILKRMDSASEIGLQGSVTIASAAELKALLAEELAAAREVRICFGASATLDICAMQLLFSAAREWRRIETNFAFVSPVPEAVSAGLAKAGFDAFAAVAEAVASSEV